MTLLRGKREEKERGPIGRDVLGGVTLTYVKLTTMQERTTREELATARDLTDTSHRNRHTMGQLEYRRWGQFGQNGNPLRQR